jgi:hypothetical protein
MRKFTEWIRDDAEDCGILSPPLDAQMAVDFLQNYLLGEDWYVINPISTQQANTEVVHTILYKYSRKYRKEWKRARRLNRQRKGE